MAKFVIPVETLGDPNTSGDHLFRFRIVSKDGVTYSKYSALYVIKSTGQIYPLQSASRYIVSSSVINVYWETPSTYNVGASATGASVVHNHGSERNAHNIDIYISWNSGEFEYAGRTKENVFPIIIKQAYTTARVYGQIANYPPTKSDLFKVFDTGTFNI